MDENHDAVPEDVPYAADHVIAIADRKTLTSNGRIIINEGILFVLLPGDGTIEERMLLSAPVGEVEVVGRPWYGLGQSVNLRVGDHRWQLQPESVTQGAGFASLGKMRRAREAAAEFEAAIADTQRAAA